MLCRDLIAGVLLAGSLSACAAVDSTVAPRYDTVSRSIAQARNESILLNIVRASHDYPLSFSTISQVIPQMTNVPLILFVHVGQTVFFGVDLLMVVGLLPGSAAALAAFSERLAFKAQARQYDRMRILFERAYQLLPERIDATTASLVRAVYRELGVEAMRENAEWVAVYRQRPIEPLP